MRSFPYGLKRAGSFRAGLAAGSQGTGQTAGYIRTGSPRKNCCLAVDAGPAKTDLAIL